jgi:hypothetical protein
MKGRKQKYLNPVSVTILAEKQLLEIALLISSATEIFHRGLTATLSDNLTDLPSYKVDRYLLMKREELRQVQEDIMVAELYLIEHLKKQEKDQLVREAFKEEADP